MAARGRADTWTPDEWLQADIPDLGNANPCECQSTKQQEVRSWDRTVFVPEGKRPIDLITAYLFKLPQPPFHAGQQGINRFNVECIASAMADPNFRWRKMCDFLIAPYEIDFSKGRPDDVEKYAGHYVLLTGHHRFLALMLCAVPPAELTSLQIRIAPMSVSYITPWPTVEWGA